jgi:hypothetical protein
MNWTGKIGNGDPGRLLILDKGETANEFNCRKIRNILILTLNLEYREQQYSIYYTPFQFVKCLFALDAESSLD